MNYDYRNMSTFTYVENFPKGVKCTFCPISFHALDHLIQN
jgi:hypothetical protein